MSQSQTIDESLYSRQLYVLGHEAMNKMLTAKVLLVGHGPLALEIAKNVCLSGVHSLTLANSQDKITMPDLGCNYYYTESDIGKNCVTVLQRALSELNPYVPIDTVDLLQEAVKSFDVVICTIPHYKVLEWAESKVVLALVNGFFSQIFCDFGSHLVADPNGEEVKSDMISNIIFNDGIADIFLVEEHRHHLQVGDVVRLSEVVGLDINKTYKVSNTKSPYSFSIDCECKGQYIKGGLFTQVKQSITVNHKTFKESMAKPEYLVSDFAKIDKQDTLHCLFVSLTEYYYSNKEFNVTEFKTVLNRSAEYFKIELNTDIVDMFIKGIHGQCPPMYGIIGGIAAQEALKKISNKFTPITQWFYFDCSELASDVKDSVLDANSRYYYQSLLFGPLLKDIQELKLFIVGSGAIGCELLKNMAMLGTSHITITDMDTIEKSNLNRQFLFRSWDVGKLKSTTAKSAILKMNPDLNIVAKSDRVGKESQSIFNLPFYKSVDIVLNALDNWEARRYMDGQCVLHNKPLLESGTLGTKGNIQVILPNKTESFTSSNDPQEESIPMCTLHNFPNKIEHTIQWGLNLFEGCFNKGPAESTLYINGQPGLNESLPYYIDIIQNKCSSWTECIQWARLQFEEHFSNSIKQLLFNFPIDSTTSQGHLFWTVPKRAPHPLVFDISNKAHFSFIEYASKLRASTYNISVENDIDISEVIGSMIIPEFVPKQGLKISTDVKDTSAPSNHHLDNVEFPKRVELKLYSLEFEKDDDSNHHVDFINVASNLRASNYDIEAVDKYTTKKISGKIIPAIATTTATTSGLVVLEMIKIVLQCKLEQFKNGFINLALPFFGFAEPIAPPTYKYNNVEFNLWDKFIIHGDVTLHELLSILKSKYKLEITMLSSGVSMLYSFFMNKQKVEERRNMKVTKIIEQVQKAEISKDVEQLILECCANGEDGEDVEELPSIILRFRDDSAMQE
eukprot:NODE_578_length_6506_cov_0.092711.p1 type:complete len:961 gc:universal NODE_578_length_6506_cov_0.092711:4553-1671(-)